MRFKEKYENKENARIKFQKLKSEVDKLMKKDDLASNLEKKLFKFIPVEIESTLNILERCLRKGRISFLDIADIGRTAESSELAIGIIYLLGKYRRDFELVYLMRCKDENPVLRRKEVCSALYYTFRKLEEDFLRNDGKNFPTIEKIEGHRDPELEEYNEEDESWE